MMESGCTRHRSRTEGMTIREGVVVRFVDGKAMPSSKALTERSTLFALERQLEEVLAPFASDWRNLPDEMSRWVVTSNREANPTMPRRPRSRPGFSLVKTRLFFPLLMPS